MAYERVNWENLPSTKTPVNADNLNKMDEVINSKQDKLTAGTGIEITGTNIINNIQGNYSTKEVKIGTWMGKPIYRRVFSFKTSDDMDLRYVHGITNVDKCWINLNASYIINNIESLPVNWYYTTNDWGRAWLNNNTIRFKSPSSLGTNRTMYLTVEYTKSTD